jgi:hypothetical protein
MVLGVNASELDALHRHNIVCFFVSIRIFGRVIKGMSLHIELIPFFIVILPIKINTKKD